MLLTTHLKVTKLFLNNNQTTKNPISSVFPSVFDIPNHSGPVMRKPSLCHDKIMPSLHYAYLYLGSISVFLANYVHTINIAAYHTFQYVHHIHLTFYEIYLYISQIKWRQTFCTYPIYMYIATKCYRFTVTNTLHIALCHKNISKCIYHTHGYACHAYSIRI